MTLIVTLALSSLFILITARSLVSQGQKNIRDSLVNRGQIILFNSQISMKRMVEENAFADIMSDISGTVDSDDEILYGMYSDMDGRVWAVRLWDELRQDSLQVLLQTLNDSILEPSYDTITIGDKNIMEFASPIFTDEGQAGIIRYGFSLEKLNNQLDSFEDKMYIFLVSAFVVLLIFLTPLVYIELKAAHRQARELTDPLSQLAHAAQGICNGDLTTPITVETNDEIGNLAQDMEKMRRTLWEYNSKLQKKIDEASIQLNSSLKEQLFQANKLVTMGTLVAGTAHEINNPNNSILLTSQNLQRHMHDLLPILDHYADICGDFNVGASTFSEEREKFSESIEQVIRNSRRIAQIVKQLKNFGRKDTSTVYEMTNINSVVKDSITILIREINKAEVSLKTSLNANVPEIIGNYQQLEQVVVNLLQNAYQAISGSGTIRIETGYSSNDKSVYITIADTGIGMDESTVEKMFDSFFTRKSNRGGTGLGLFVSQRIVKEHCGEIRIQSTLNKGTVATVVLPVEPKGGENELLFTTSR